jgi:hypothetical protein
MPLIMSVYRPGDVLGEQIVCESPKRHKAFAEFGELTATLKPGEVAKLRDGERELASYGE